MKDFSSYFWENVKEKTDLTPWLLKIKSQPKDGLTWLVLADWLEERGGLDEQVGHFIRYAIELQKHIASNNHDAILPLQNASNELGMGIARQFQDLGYTDVAGNAYGDRVNVPKPIIRGQQGTSVGTRWGAAKTMSFSVNTRDNQGEDKGVGLHNVAAHDIADRTLQLLLIFNMAQRVAVSHLKVQDEQPNCKKVTNRSVIASINELRQAYHRNPDNTRNIWRGLQIVMKQTHDCPQRLKADGIYLRVIPAIERMTEMMEEEPNDGSLYYTVLYNALDQWRVALRSLADGNPTEYVAEVRRILARFRNEQHARRSLNWRD